MRHASTVLALLAVACSVLGTPSKIRSGDLFASGSPRYDGYFGEVHAQQVAAKAWPEERRAARRPLVDTLHLTGDTDDATIAQSTKDRLSSGVLRLEVRGTEVHIVETAASHHDSPQDVLSALEQAANAEIARATKLAQVPARASELAKTGHELEVHIAEDFAGDGQKPFDVREELHASFEVLQTIADAAQRERRSADQFVAELGRAVSTGSEVPSATPPKPKPAPTPSKPEPPPKPKPAPKPSPPPARTEPVAAAPKPPPPKPAAKSDANEVFNP